MLYLTLRQYHYIVAAADAESLTKAAAILHVSQPSLSVAINRVEARLGRAIFNRGKGSAISVTPYGIRFVALARDLLHRAQHIEKSGQTAGPFIVGCFEDLAPWYLPKTLATLRTRFPDTPFEGREGRFSTLASGMAEGRIDVAITYDIGFASILRRQKIKDVMPHAFMAPTHPLAKCQSIELSQLRDQHLILSSEDLSLDYIRRLFDQMMMNPEVMHRATSLEMMRSLAAHGMGIGLSYSNPPTAHSYDGQPLVAVPIHTQAARADIMMIWKDRTGRTQIPVDILAAIHDQVASGAPHALGSL